MVSIITVRRLRRILNTQLCINLEKTKVQAWGGTLRPIRVLLTSKTSNSVNVFRWESSRIELDKTSYIKGPGYRFIEMVIKLEVMFILVLARRRGLRATTRSALVYSLLRISMAAMEIRGLTIRAVMWLIYLVVSGDATNLKGRSSLSEQP